eukprot:g4715.t1
MMESVNAVAKPLFESHSDLLFTKLYIEGPDEECKVGNDTIASINVVGQEFIQRYQNKSWLQLLKVDHSFFTQAKVENWHPSMDEMEDRVFMTDLSMENSEDDWTQMEIGENDSDEELDRHMMLESIQRRLDYLETEKCKLLDGLNGKAVHVDGEHVNIDNYESMGSDVVWNVSMNAAQKKEETIQEFLTAKWGVEPHLPHGIKEIKRALKNRVSICGLEKDEKVQRDEYNSDMSFDKWEQRKSSDYKEVLKSISPEDKAKALNEAKEILGEKKSSWKGSAKLKAKLKDALDEGIEAFGPLESGSVKDFEELAEYHFTIEYLKGKDNVKADAMSRQGKDKIEQEEIKEDKVYSIRVRLEDPVHDGTGYARFRFTTPESVFAMSGCTLSLEELENVRDFDKKKPRGLVCHKRDNWKGSVHFVSEEAYAFQAATEPLPDICCKDSLDTKIYEVYDEILWKESEKPDSL